MNDDFIEDDDGSGYVDDGRDDWDNRRRQNGEGEDDDDEDSEDAEEYYARTGRKKSSKRKTGADSKKKRSAALADAFGKQQRTKPRTATGTASAMGPSNAANAMDAYRPAVNREKEDDFMRRLMGGLNSDEVVASPSPVTRIARSSLGNSSLNVRKRKPDDSSTAPLASFRQIHTPSSPSTGPPSSDPLDPLSSDDAGHGVHIRGGDTPPWGLVGDEEDQLHNKRFKVEKGLPTKRIDSLDLKDAADMLSRRSTSVIDPSLELHNDEDDVDDGDGFSVRAPEKNVHLVSTTNVRATKAQHTSTPATPAKPTVSIKQEQLDEEDLPMPEAAPAAAIVEEPCEEKATPILKKSWQTIGAGLANVNDVPSPSTSASASTSTSTSPSNVASSKVKPFEADGRKLRFFWTDYTEQQGIIYLIGKVRDHSTDRFVSACLQVEGIERCVYLLPREGFGEEEVYDDFDALTSKHGIKSFLAKWVPRKYAFEIPGVPAEGNYLKVKYGFDEPQLPIDIQGRTFSRAFGTNTSAFELFVVKRNIMGPCWLDVECASLRAASETPLSWCKVELTVDDAKFVKPFADTDQDAPRDTPPLTVMSLSVRTIINHKENKREIVACAARTWKDTQLEEATPPENVKSDLFSVVRPLGSMFPPGFEREAKTAKPTRVLTVKYERMLLNALLAHVQQQDPDVIVGHEFAGVTLDVLLHRIKELRVDHWSRLGRLRRQKWPPLRQGFNLRLVSGRLICDLASDTAKGMIPSTTWSLTEMVGTHLKAQREDIDPDDTAAFFDHLAPNGERLMTFVRHNEVDAFFQMALASKVQILALTKQLTNLAGNSWARTLNGGRAERNEYILLHDFHRQKFICPDKLNKVERQQLLATLATASGAKKGMKRSEDDDHEGDGDHDDDNDEDGGTGGGKSSKKDKFKGGLVFEPKRGLWDKYILVMDFNSLYPSIIQEFNIDFTTVDRSEHLGTGATAGSQDVPEVPSSDVKQGVLPRLISTLVQRRRQVKSLMKDRNAPASKHLQWDIKQLALKLTANSMYGCLGFEGSRFYARPLAALTTFKGREILTATKELAESLSLDVVYGDTDSVMINTHATDLMEAMRIGQEFKRAVNERYRLLEIDIDAVFARMLLLQKKKYAALKVDIDAGDQARFSTEIKGLDMKRREYCALSKNVSEYVLSQILSGEATDTVVEHIHEYLAEMSEQVRESKVNLDDFIVYKRLSKKVSEYAESAAKSLPHVQVAKRMADRGVTVRMGDVIPYVFCLGDDGSSASKTAQADRAYHPDEVRKAGSTLRIDFEHYLALQVLPPIERLCDSIQGTDRARLAEQLGLEASRYVSVSSTGGSGASSRDTITTLDSQTPDEVRFAQCEAITLQCGSCGQSSEFTGLPGVMRGDATALKMLPASCSGLCCSHCEKHFGMVNAVMQIEARVRDNIARYYQAATVCTEPACGAETRVIGVYARRCLMPGCSGKTVAKYSDKALYDQLCFFESLVDRKRALERAVGPVRYDDVAARCVVAETNTARTLDAMRNAIARYTQRSGRRYVGLDSLFGWMKVEA